MTVSSYSNSDRSFLLPGIRGKALDIGMSYGLLTILSSKKRGGDVYICICECGNYRDVDVSMLRSRDIKLLRLL
jgi:hypothetical protein